MKGYFAVRIHYLGAQKLIIDNSDELQMTMPSGAMNVSYMDHCGDGPLLRRHS